MIADLILNVEAEAVAVVFEFSAKDGFDAGISGGFDEFDRAVEIVFVSKGDGGEVVTFGEINDGVDGKGGVEEGVVAVDVEGDEGGEGRGATSP